MEGSAVDGDREVVVSPPGDVNVVLVGRAGNGKSATGNSIIGSNVFKSKTSVNVVTATCELQRTILKNGQGLNVIDTPGLMFDSAKAGLTEKEIANCISMAKDGVHAVLVVLSVRSRFTEDENAVVSSMCDMFSRKICDYMIVVFTGGDELEESDATLDEYLHDCPKSLKDVLAMCGDRRVLFDNKTKDEAKKSEQMKQLLCVVNALVDKNGGKLFTDEIVVEQKMEALKLKDESKKPNAKKKKKKVDKANAKKEEEKTDDLNSKKDEVKVEEGGRPKRVTRKPKYLEDYKL